jgi:DNA (cytosine-5)-methyltransferase 1
MRSFRFVDLFAGLGGFHLAARRLGGKCVFASEIDPELREAYEANLGLIPAGDIRQVSLRDIPQHDVLCAGFPCQPFSKAGEQKGWRDAIRGTVFFRVVEILQSHRPEHVILENVPHFIAHDGGNTYAKVKQALQSLGYELQHAKLSPHQFGIPQIRERIYMVGRLGGLAAFEWPRPTTDAKELSIQSVLDRNPPDAQPLGEQVLRCMDVWQEFLQTFPRDGKLPSFPIWSMEFQATYP